MAQFNVGSLTRHGRGRPVLKVKGNEIDCKLSSSSLTIVGCRG